MSTKQMCIVCDKKISDEKIKNQEYLLADSLLILSTHLQMHKGRCAKEYQKNIKIYQLKFKENYEAQQNQITVRKN